MIKTYGNIVSLISELKERSNDYIISRMKSCGIEGLVTSHGRIMLHLYMKGPSRMADVAKAINKKKNTVTTLINKLVTHGYVQIVSDYEDQRVKIVELTPKGLDIKADFFKISSNLIEQVFQGIDEDKRKEIVEYLRIMINNLS